jgi:hypothetical protein
LSAGLLHGCKKFDEVLHATARSAIADEIYHELTASSERMLSKDAHRRTSTFIVEDVAEQI